MKKLFRMISPLPVVCVGISLFVACLFVWLIDQGLAIVGKCKDGNEAVIVEHMYPGLGECAFYIDEKYTSRPIPKDLIGKVGVGTKVVVHVRKTLIFGSACRVGNIVGMEHEACCAALVCPAGCHLSKCHNACHGCQCVGK